MGRASELARGFADDVLSLTYLVPCVSLLGLLAGFLYRVTG